MPWAYPKIVGGRTVVPYDLPMAKDAYPWHLNNRNKRGLALDLKSPDAGKILEGLVKWADVLIVNTPHLARKKLKLEYDDVAQWKFPPDLRRPDWLW